MSNILECNNECLNCPNTECDKRDNDLLMARLSKIEGQIRGIKSMIENKRDCDEILMQLSAVSSAVTNAAKFITSEHIKHCVLNGIRSGDELETINSLEKVVSQFAKFK